MQKITILSAILITLGFYGISWVIHYFIFFIDLVDIESNLELWKWSPSILTVISSIIILVLVYLFLKVIYFPNTQKNQKSNTIHVSYIFYSVLLAPAILIIQRLFLYVEDFINNTNLTGAINTNQMDFESWLIPSLISTTIISPISEELIFRKIIFAKLNENYKFYFALIISTVLFALIHLPYIHQSISALVTGAVAAILYQNTGKILYPIILHVTLNSLVMFSRFSTLI